MTYSTIRLAYLSFVSLLAFGSSATAADRCENVRGFITANFTSPTTVEGTVTDKLLAGAVSAVILDIQQSGEGALHVQLQHTFTTNEGSALFTMDQAVLSPVDPPLYRMNTRYAIVGGTGIFENATGFLRNHGEVFVDPDGGALSLRLHGQVCAIQ